MGRTYPCRLPHNSHNGKRLRRPARAHPYNICVIHLLYGKDNYRVHRALASIRAELGAGEADGALESNTTVLDGKALSPQELFAHATAAPFLASNRLVIVEGLLAALGRERGTRKGKGKKKGDDEDPLVPWREAAAQLGDTSSMPETTTLVFVEGEIGKNAAFTIFAAVATTTEYAPLAPPEVTRWVRDGARERGTKISDKAADALARSSGGDLWALSNELEKLAAYAGREPIDEAMVAELVETAAETKMWDLTDPIVGGDERAAIHALQRLLAEGEPPPVLLAVIAGQYRRMVVVKDMLERRVPKSEIAKAIDSKGREFIVDKAARLANRYGWPALHEAYRKLLDADLSVKRGLQDDESALQLLVHELCALAPKASQRPAYAR